VDFNRAPRRLPPPPTRENSTLHVVWAYVASRLSSETGHKSDADRFVRRIYTVQIRTQAPLTVIAMDEGLR